jgi:L-cysteine desulfidase
MKTIKTKEIFILNLLDRIVTPALGCTEIGCIALATSITSEHLKLPLAKAIVYVSGFIYRNVINVGVPFIGRVGAKGIAAAGFIIKQSNRGLLILEGVSNTQVHQIKQLIAKDKIKVIIQRNCNPVYVRVVAKDIGGNTYDVLIERGHDNVKFVRINNINLPIESYKKCKAKKTSQPEFDVDDITLADIYHTIKKVKLKKLIFLQKGIEMNENIANFPNKNLYFHPINKKSS